MNTQNVNPLGWATLPVQHWGLLKKLVVREVSGRYRGSVLGWAWSFILPLLMLAVYTFVFSVVFQARWPDAVTNSKLEFALILFAGLLVFNIFAECASRAPNLIVHNSNYVTKVVFPLALLPWVVMGSAFFHFLTSLLVWLVFYGIAFGLPHLSALWLPVVILPFAILMIAMLLVLSSLGVYLRDVGHMVSVAITILMFMSPIFYPISALPAQYQVILHINPLVGFIEQLRAVLLFNSAPDWVMWGWQCAGALGVVCLAHLWFEHAKRGFADVL